MFDASFDLNNIWSNPTVFIVEVTKSIFKHRKSDILCSQLCLELDFSS